jgi:hypothetical protein
MFATSRSRGSTMVMVLGFAATVSSLALLTISSSTSNYNAARARLESTKAFYVAEGGMDYCLGQLAADRYFPARSTASFPTVDADGSFLTDWRPLGTRGGDFQVRVAYVAANKVPTTWTSPGLPPGFAPFTNLVFGDRASSELPFDRIQVTVSGRYNGTTRWVRAGVKFMTKTYGGAIVSDAAPIAGSGSGKSFAISNDAVVFDTAREYVHGGIMSNGPLWVGGTSQPLTGGNVNSLLAGFSGSIQQNLYGSAKEIPDYTDPGSTTQLFDFNRFKAAAAAGAGAVYPDLTSFAAAMRAANALGQPLQGIIHVTIDAAVEGGSPTIDTSTKGTGVGPEGINVQGTLVFHFTNAPDRFYKMWGEAPIHINAGANDATFDPADPATFKTGYPPVLPAAKDPRNVDISGLGFKNFGPDDDLPALMFDNGTVDIHQETNICGAMYSPSFMEIENKSNARQYFNGCIISGGGIYLDAGGSPGVQVMNFDPSTVDMLPTYDMRAQTPTIATYSGGK